MKQEKENINKKDLIIKIVLIVIIIILLLHNCVILKGNKNQNNVPRTPNGNVDIIEIKCDDSKCTKDDKSNNQGKLPTSITSISFSQNNYGVKVGNKLKLIPIIKPSDLANAKLTWTSSNSSVATVDENGVVTGISPGTVTITARSANGKLATCTITVSEKDIEVESITLNPTETTVKVGSTVQITATVSPTNATNSEIVWSSSNPSVAKVDQNGLVTGVAVGDAIITAKTTDGKVVATTKITVDNDDETNDFKVYDKDYNPVTWNGSTDLKIFTKSIYNVDGFLAPESENTYEFIVKNGTDYTLKYEIKFNETNLYDINMKYKLKRNDTYVYNEYVKASAMDVENVILAPGEHATYYLDWKWISSSNDTDIGANPSASYGLQIEVKAESIDG